MVFQGLPGHLQRNAFDVLKIGVGVHTDIHRYRQLLLRVVIVDQFGVGQLAVEHDHYVVGQHPDPRGAPADFFHEALLAEIQFNAVSHPDRFAEDQLEAGKEILQGWLQGQGDGQER